MIGHPISGNNLVTVSGFPIVLPAGSLPGHAIVVQGGVCVDTSCHERARTEVTAPYLKVLWIKTHLFYHKLHNIQPSYLNTMHRNLAIVVDD